MHASIKKIEVSVKLLLAAMFAILGILYFLGVVPVNNEHTNNRVRAVAHA